MSSVYAWGSLALSLMLILVYEIYSHQVSKRDPTRPHSRRAVLAAGAMGKAVYFVVCAALVSAGVGGPLVLAFGLGDLLMAALFAWALLSQGRGERGDATWATV
jgi:predicted permease